MRYCLSKAAVISATDAVDAGRSLQQVMDDIAATVAHPRERTFGRKMRRSCAKASETVDVLTAVARLEASCARAARVSTSPFKARGESADIPTTLINGLH